MIRIINLISRLFSKINLQNKKEILFDISEIDIFSPTNGRTWKYRGLATLKNNPEHMRFFKVDMKGKEFFPPTKKMIAKAEKDANKILQKHFLTLSGGNND